MKSSLKNISFDFKHMKNFSYIFLSCLLIFTIIYVYSFQYKVTQNLNFREMTNLNSNTIKKEGFSNNNYKKNYNKYKQEDDIYKLIENKLRGISEELGGESGKKEVKKILINTKKICNLECAKCMMNMIEENKGIKSVDFDKILDDESNDNCIKCRKYTELSDSIKSMIDNL